MKLHDEAKMDCPYMDCVHAAQPPEDDPTMTEAEVEAAVLAHDEMQAEADAKAEKEAAEAAEWEEANNAAEKSAAAAEEAEKKNADAEMDTGDDTSEKPPTQDLR